MEQQTFKYNNQFTLENGYKLPEVEIGYYTYGTLSANADNVIWVCHALTASADVADWWPSTVEKGKFLDPERYFIVCANILGSCYGTTGPLSVNPITGEPYYGTFPKITVRDVVNVHRLLAEHLQIKQVKMLIGSSVGGFQVSEWLVLDPKFATKAVILASASKADAWTIAFNESQRMAIDADPTYGEPSAYCAEKGLAAARSIALLSYRGRDAYMKTQSESIEDYEIKNFKASSYQRYQGSKLVNRFNAYSYYRLTEIIDSHNLARGRESMENALNKIEAEVVIIAISSDILFPISAHDDFCNYIRKSSIHIIESDFGHDGFLIEYEKLNKIIINFLNK